MKRATIAFVLLALSACALAQDPYIDKICKGAINAPMDYQLPSWVTDLNWMGPADIMHGGGDIGHRKDVPEIQSWFPSTFVGQSYCIVLRVGGGTPPYVFSSNNPLPYGFKIHQVNSTVGLLAGAGDVAGTFAVNLSVTDAAGTALPLAPRMLQVCAKDRNSSCDGFGN